MASDQSDDEDFVYYGTRLQDQEELGPFRKIGQAPVDAATVRAAPVHQQEVTDEQGRRRFHGAFTGGFSAGYFNTVGSKEGFEPAAFRSSRSERGAAVQQRVEDFLDEDEKAEAAKSDLQLRGEYDTFGARAAEAERSAAQAAADARPSLIPGLVPRELVAPAPDGVGVRLLQLMGWRPGKGVAAADAGADAPGGGGRAASKWGAVAGVLMENTPLYILEPKEDRHGLGYDAFRSADEFREAKRRRTEEQAARGGRGGGGGRSTGDAKRVRGVAFGTGVLEETDTLGYMEDYVGEGGAAGQMPRGLKREALAFEEPSEESDDEDRFNPSRLRQGPLRLGGAGAAAPLLLTSREEQSKHGSFVPGFRTASVIVEAAQYPAPEVPAGWRERHRFDAPAGPGGAGAAAAPDAPPPPQAPPPPDPALRRDIDALAAQVARSGPAAEQLARSQAAVTGKYAFLLPGAAEGGAYYAWRLHTIRSALAAAAAAVGAAGARLDAAATPAPPPRRLGLSVEERAALLGEAPLPSAPTPPAGADGSGATAAPAAPASRAVASSVVQSDRQRLAAALAGQFVLGEQQELTKEAQQQQEAMAGLWRPQPKAPALPAAAAAFLAGVSGRFAGGSGADTAVLPPDAASGGLTAPPPPSSSSTGGPAAAASQGDRQASQRAPRHTVEEWRPLPLLCKRFNVPDPYRGRAAAQHTSRFKTDHLALPDTDAAMDWQRRAAAAAAEAALLPPPPAQPPPPPAAAALPPPPPYPPPPPAHPAQDVSSMAADLMGELAAEFAAEDRAAATSVAAAAPPAEEAPRQQPPEQSSGARDEDAAALPPLPPEPPPPLPEEVVAVTQKPMDLFKAIFEAEDETSEEEEEEEGQGQAGVSATVAASAGGGVGAAQAAAVESASTKAKGLADAFLHQATQGGRAAAGASNGAASASGAARGEAGLPPPPAAAAAAAAADVSSLVTPEQQRRLEILAALKSLKKSKKKKVKKKKHKKERGSSSKGKHKGGKSSSGKKRRREGRGSSGGGGERRRRDARDSGNSGSSDSSGSDDDSSGSLD